MVIEEKTDLLVGAVALKFLDRFKHDELREVLVKKPSPGDPALNALTRSAFRIISAPRNRASLNKVLLRHRWWIFFFSSPKQWEAILDGTHEVLFVDPESGEEYRACISELRPTHLFMQYMEELKSSR